VGGFNCSLAPTLLVGDISEAYLLWALLSGNSVDECDLVYVRAGEKLYGRRGEDEPDATVKQS
jgi:hypothetical protein